MIPAWITALLQMLTEGFKFGSKVTPPDEIRIDKHEEKKELREQDFSQAEIEDDFDYCKSRPEITIDNYLREVHKDKEVTSGYIQLITERVTAYRKDVVKRKGWRWRRHRDWLEAQIETNK